MHRKDKSGQDIRRAARGSDKIRKEIRRGQRRGEESQTRKGFRGNYNKNKKARHRQMKRHDKSI